MGISVLDCTAALPADLDLRADFGVASSVRLEGFRGVDGCLRAEAGVF